MGENEGKKSRKLYCPSYSKKGGCLFLETERMIKGGEAKDSIYASYLLRQT